MNRVPLFICGLVLAACLVGASTLKHFAAELSQKANDPVPVRCPASVEEEKRIIGHSETIAFGDERALVFSAKIDSGAETSSLHALKIKTFSRKERDSQTGEREVLFVSFETSDDQGKVVQLERMVSRIDQVRSASGVSTRYFFREKIWINEASYEIEINLADRSGLSKKMLIGKNLLNQGYLIDTNQSNIITRTLSNWPKL